MNGLEAIEDGLAAYRLTRLVTADVISERPRRAIIEAAYRRKGRELRVDDATSETVVEAVRASEVNEGPAPKLATLFTCRYCASVYLAAGIVLLRRRFPKLWRPVAEASALSAVAALVARFETD